MRQTRSARRALIPLLAALLVAAACGGGDDAGSGGGGDGTGELQTDAVLRVAHNLTVQQGTHLDPRFSRTNTDLPILLSIYSPLATFDPVTRELTPYLAESWNVVDPQTVEVALRPDAVFHDGRPVTSEDVRATIESMKANVAESLNNVNPSVGLIEEIEPVDDKNFVVHLSQPAVAALLEMFADRPFLVVPADAGEEQDRQPVGTGPFRAVQFTPGERVVVEKFEDHWLADDVHLAGIEFIHTIEGQTMNNALRSGGVDWAQVDLGTYQNAQGGGEIAAEPFYSDGQLLYLDMCKDHGSPFEDVELRRAVAYAVDKEAISESVYDGLAEPSDSQLWPRDTPEYDEDLGEPYPHDPDRAREILADAGIPEGTTVTLWTLRHFSEMTDTQLLIQQQLAEVGLEVELVAGDDISGDYWAPAHAGNPGYDGMVMRSQRTGIQKASYFFSMESDANSCRYADEEVAGLLEQLAGLEPGTDEAVEAWHELQRIVAEDVLMLNLAFEPQFYGWQSRLVGVVDGEQVPAGDVLVHPIVGAGPRWDLLALTG